jgi:hypothetical protein
VAILNLHQSNVGGALQDMLMFGDILPGDAPSYQLCKTIYAYHPLGKKIADTPISLMLTQPREISVPTGPERVREQFETQWVNDGVDGHIFSLGSMSRVYGLASIALLAGNKKTGKLVPSTEPIDYDKLWELEVAFNVLDPLNTAGSLVGDLDPNSLSFMKSNGIAVAGTPYHRSRTVTKLNEKPLYLEYTTSAFGYQGRSVYQRMLYLLKSYIKTMIADDMVATKSGVIIAAIRQAGSIVNATMQRMFAMKRDVVKEAQTNNVISIDPEERIESLNLQNVNAALEGSRKNILNNIATAADMPAILINGETYAEGFGEGSEDAMNVARYIKGVRDEFQAVYEWFDDIVMHRAWNPEFYKTIQEEFPEEYGEVPYKTAFQSWKNSFDFTWPSLIEEPESEKVKVSDVKLKGIIAMVQVLLPEMDPDNRAAVVAWAQDNFNEIEAMFTVPLNLDMDAFQEHADEQAEQQKQQAQAGAEGGGEGGEGDDPEASGGKGPPPPKPFADSQVRRVA